MSESSSIYLGNHSKDLTISSKLEGISKVVIWVTDDLFYTAGNDTGRTLTIDCPWGTQNMAENILVSVQGYSYQPYEATDAIINPLAEIGDGISATGIYSGIYNMGISYGSTLKYALSAPYDEEVDHEYQYIPNEERKFGRSLTELRTELSAELKVTADKITASAMTKTGGSTESFGWALNSSSWQIDADGNTVLSVDKNGLSVSGKVTASSGTIGGFTIGTASIYNKISSLSDTTTESGVYIGTDGIRLGKNFSVNSSGAITATGGTFGGTIRCDALYVKNSSGGYDAISTSTVKSSLAGGASYNSSGWPNYSAPTIARFANNGNQAYNGTIAASTIVMGGKRFAPRSIRFIDPNGNVQTVTVLLTQD